MEPNAVLDALVGAVLARAKEQGNPVPGLGGPYYRATPSTPSTPYYTGPGGLFGVMGLERDIISSRMQPFGLADRLPAIGTNVMNPMFAYFTGFTPSTGAVAEGVCDDPPTAGSGLTCIQTAQFGRVSYQTRTLEVNRLGQQINRGEFQDLRFFNDPLANGIGGITTPAGVGSGGNLRQEVAMRMVELGVDFQLTLSRMIYEGNPSNNSGGDGYREFPGLDILIGTNKVDALTNTACDALDSDIKDANYQRVDAAGDYYVDILSALMHYLRTNASGMNFGQTTWAIVMRPELFWELSAVWPCVYMTYRCRTSGGAEPDISAVDMIRMRDDMRNSSYILIDGIRYEVIQDNNIREETQITGPGASIPSGCAASDIYVIPLTTRGGVPVTYWEYFDYRTSLNILGAGPLAAQWFWSDGGKFLWHFKPPANWCIQWLCKIEPRLILRTPQLAGRLLNVLYCPRQHTRDVRTTDPYFVGGGQGGRTGITTYAEWGTVS